MEPTEGKEPAPQASLHGGQTSTGRRAGAATPGDLDTIGRIEPRFPRLSVQKESAQAHTARLSDRQALQKVLSERGDRYLARQMRWVPNQSQLFSVK